MADPRASGKGKGGEEGSKSPSIVVLIIAALIVTLVAAAGGGALGMMLADMVKAPEPAKQETEKPKAEAETGGKPARGSGEHQESEADAENEPIHLELKPLEPILANLAAPAGAWIRIEAALLLDEEGAKDADILAAKTSEDILGFLRTVSLAQIEGASGYLHLREDLTDLVKFKSEGHVRELVLQSMVVE